MRYLIICSLVLIATSCMTVNKAKKVLDNNPQEAAGYCAAKFPVKEGVDSIVTNPDPHIIRNAIDSAVHIQDSICNDYANAMNDLLAEQQKLINAKDSTWTPMVANASEKVFKLRIDSLKKDYQNKVQKESQRLADAVPAKQITVTKTVENTAKVEYYRIESEKQAQLAKDYQVKFSKWKKIALISFGIIAVLIIIIFRRPILGLIGRLSGIALIPPI